MNLLLESDLELLLEERPGPCLSFYLPVPGTGAQAQQGPIRLKNLLGRAGEDLRAQGLDKMAVEALLDPLEDLLADLSFWNTREETIALFRAPGFTRAFYLPRAMTERYVVGNHFFLKPLLPLVAPDETFYVLALSQNETRLLEATCRTVRRLAPDDLPRNLVGALGEQTTAKDLQYHTASRAGAAFPAVYHGGGGDEGETKAELRRYLRQIEGALRKLLAGRTAPLVLAGAEPLPSLYREINAYPHLAGAVIPGNPEHMTDVELRDRAWRILVPTFQEARHQAAERFGELAGTGRASNDVREILSAAHDGRVESLFLDCAADLWGRLDDRLGKIQVHAAPEEGDEDLLDTAALFSLRYGGTVYGVDHGEVPGGGDLAAVFRY
jgi:hypothetical protein